MVYYYIYLLHILYQSKIMFLLKLGDSSSYTSSLLGRTFIPPTHTFSDRGVPLANEPSLPLQANVVSLLAKRFRMQKVIRVYKMSPTAAKPLS